jgi:hypothetical protein
MLAWASLIVGAVLAIAVIVELWRMRKARLSELIATLGQTWDSKLLMEARQRANELANTGKLKQAIDDGGKANSEEFFILMRIPNFFDSIGAMVEHGDLPTKLAKELFEKPAGRYWELYGNALSAIDLEGVSHFRQLVERFQA